MQMDVQVGGRAKALDESDRARVGCATFQSRLLDQKARDNPVDNRQHRREQFGMGGEEDAQRNGKREHPLPYRHARDDAIDQVRGALSPAPGAARGAKPAALAGKRHQLLMGALGAAQAQKSVRQNAAFEKGLETRL